MTLALCETHWRPLRRCLLEQVTAGQGADVLLRGPIVPDVLPLVPAHPAIRHQIAARPWFPLAALWTAVGGTLNGRYDRILVDKPKWAIRLRRWAPWTRRRCVIVHADTARGYRLESPCASP